ncbi:MAG: CBS domain-containing protein [Deltaproteobacteria bacterium]|nr:MAG: CBS domain-containing protein [Deltaproteobacteria bacterium]
MTKNTLVLSGRDPVHKAFLLLKDNKIRHLPVVEKDRIVGIVTDRDIRHFIIPRKDPKTKGKFNFQLKDLKVEDVMTSDPITVTPDTRIEQVARLMLEHKIGGIPVVDQKRRLVGIVTEEDTMRVFVELLGILESDKRIDVTMDTRPRTFERVCQIIEDHGASVISVGISPEKNKGKRTYYFRINVRKLEPVITALNQEGFTAASS